MGSLSSHAPLRLFADPFADAIKGSDDDVQDGLVHIRIQQRNGRKTLTTVQGLSSEYDLKKIVRACKKVSVPRFPPAPTKSGGRDYPPPPPPILSPALATNASASFGSSRLSAVSHHRLVRQNSKNRSDANNHDDIGWTDVVLQVLGMYGIRAHLQVV